MINDIIVATFLVTGSFFMLVAAIGIYRLPDTYMRMHATSKASSFGSLLMLVAATIHFQTWYVLIESLLIIIFIFLTTPVATHMIGHVAHLLNIPLWKNTHTDELKKSQKKV